MSVCACHESSRRAAAGVERAKLWRDARVKSRASKTISNARGDFLPLSFCLTAPIFLKYNVVPMYAVSHTKSCSISVWSTSSTNTLVAQATAGPQAPITTPIYLATKTTMDRQNTRDDNNAKIIMQDRSQYMLNCASGTILIPSVDCIYTCIRV
jgi:hypothetical protein